MIFMMVLQEAEADDSLESQGMLGLGWWPNGTKQFTNSKRLPKTPEDFHGLKSPDPERRCSGRPVQALGRFPRPRPLLEVYTGLNNKPWTVRKIPLTISTPELPGRPEIYDGFQPRTPGLRGSHQYDLLEFPFTGK